MLLGKDFEVEKKIKYLKDIGVLKKYEIMDSWQDEHHLSSV